MTPAELEALAVVVCELALLAGFVGACFWQLFRLACELVLSFLARRHDKALRIRDARWRSHWNRALRDAREAGYTGSRQVAFAANAMRTRRAAIDELRAM
ncbi:hypothetical protein [Paracidovorax wautersii]|uniref:hypothetical protein n=1 Tax=Paracidovorax wautersii TaxID=1177982 RepID=UPI0031DD6C7C